MIWVIVRGWKCENLLPRCLKSLSDQTYAKWKAIVAIDEFDGALRLGRNMSGGCFVERKGAMQSLFLTMTGYILSGAIKGDDIIVLLDADDQLVPHALDIVDCAYKIRSNIAVAYGGYINESNYKRGAYSGIYKKIEDVRTDRWKASHIKSFRAGLFTYINQSDFYDSDGNWLKTCSDLAIMFPMLELAGLDRVVVIDSTTYIYNNISPLSDHILLGDKQR